MKVCYWGRETTEEAGRKIKIFYVKELDRKLKCC